MIRGHGNGENVPGLVVSNDRHFETYAGRAIRLWAGTTEVTDCEIAAMQRPFMAILIYDAQKRSTEGDAGIYNLVSIAITEDDSIP